MIDKFDGLNSFLSNFYPLPEGKTLEHYYQAAKTSDVIWQQRILDAKTPGDAKRLGGLCPMNPDWASVKLDIMLELVRLKFSDPWLARMLLFTGNEDLIERSYWGDTFWGVCNGVGANHLGKILMQVRAELFCEFNTDTP